MRPSLALICAVLVACGGGYQPWPKTAGETTCREWVDDMTPDQRTGLATAILGALWDSQGAGSTPSPELGAKLANAVGQVCSNAPTEKVNSVASSLYLLADDLKP